MMAKARRIDMAKVNTSKTDGKRYLNIEVGEFEGEAAKAWQAVGEAREALRQAEAKAIAETDKAFPELARHPIQFKWGKISVGLDAKRDGASAPVAKAQSLSQFLASQANSGRGHERD